MGFLSSMTREYHEYVVCYPTGRKEGVGGASGYVYGESVTMFESPASRVEAAVIARSVRLSDALLKMQFWN